MVVLFITYLPAFTTLISLLLIDKLLQMFKVCSSHICLTEHWLQNTAGPKASVHVSGLNVSHLRCFGVSLKSSKVSSLRIHGDADGSVDVLELLQADSLVHCHSIWMATNLHTVICQMKPFPEVLNTLSSKNIMTSNKHLLTWSQTDKGKPRFSLPCSYMAHLSSHQTSYTRQPTLHWSPPLPESQTSCCFCWALCPTWKPDVHTPTDTVSPSCRRNASKTPDGEGKSTRGGRFNKSCTGKY